MLHEQDVDWYMISVGGHTCYKIFPKLFWMLGQIFKLIPNCAFTYCYDGEHLLIQIIYL